MSQSSKTPFNPWLLLYYDQVKDHLKTTGEKVPENETKLLDTSVEIIEDDVIVIGSDSETSSQERVTEPPEKKIKQEQDSILTQSFLTQVVPVAVETKLDVEFEFENLIQLSEQEISELCIKTGETISEKSLARLLEALIRSDVENPYMHLINKHVLIPKFLSTEETSRNFEMALRKYIERFPLIAIETFFVPVLSNKEFTKAQCDMFTPWIQDSYSQSQKTELFRKLLQHNTSFENTSIMTILHMLLTKVPTCIESHENDLISKISDSPILTEDDVIFGKLILLVTQRTVSIDEDSKRKLQYLIQNISKTFIKKSAQKAFDKIK